MNIKIYEKDVFLCKIQINKKELRHWIINHLDMSLYEAGAYRFEESLESKFYEAREKLPLEERDKFTREVWKFQPDNWLKNPNWVEGAYLEYLKKQEKIIKFLENKLVRGKK